MRGNTSVTKEEVRAAVEKATVHGDERKQVSSLGKFWSQASKVDIAGVIARDRGWDGRSQMYTSQASAIRKWVTVGQVQRHLETLAAEGTIRAIPGHHPFLRGRNGTMGKATYYLSEEAYDMAREKARGVWLMRRSSAAETEATNIIVARHKEEWDEEVLAYCAERPVPEYLEDSGVAPPAG